MTHQNNIAGKQEKERETTNLSVAMSPELRERIRVAAAKRGMMSSPFAVEILEGYFDEEVRDEAQQRRAG